MRKILALLVILLALSLCVEKKTSRQIVLESIKKYQKLKSVTGKVEVRIKMPLIGENAIMGDYYQLGENRLLKGENFIFLGKAGEFYSCILTEKWVCRKGEEEIGEFDPEKTEEFLNKNIWVIEDDYNTMKVAGRECYLIRGKIDLNKLAIEEGVQNIGEIRSMVMRVCYDKRTGYPLLTESEVETRAGKMITTMRVLSFEENKEIDVEFELPEGAEITQGVPFQ